LAKECHFNTQTGLFLSYDFLFISAKNIRENDALDVFPPYLSINCSFFSKVPAFFSIYSYFVDFFYMADNTLSSLRPVFTLSTSAPVDCQGLCPEPSQE